MAKEKYVAYVGTYTHTNSVGIHVYDVNPETGVFCEKAVAPINNPSYVTISKDGKHLYSIEDEGVAAFNILSDGNLEKVNQNWIGGMRGDYIDVDSKNRFLFVGGFHDGRVTMMKLAEDGSIGDVAFGLFHQSISLGGNERHLDHAKVTCVKLTPDEKYLCAVDIGINQIKVYRIDYNLGHLTLVDIVRPELDAGVREVQFSKDGKFMYALTSFNNSIEVYSYKDEDDEPVFERIQTISVLKKADESSAASAMAFTDDEKYLFVSVDGMNATSWLLRDEKTGKLSYAGQTTNSGEFPKDIAVLPGNKFLAVINHDTNELRTFRVDYKDGYALMVNPPVKLSKGNSIIIHKITG